MLVRVMCTMQSLPSRETVLRTSISLVYELLSRVVCVGAYPTLCVLQVDEVVIGSHKDNAGYGGQGSLALLLMKWLIEPIFEIIRCGARGCC